MKATIPDTFSGLIELLDYFKTPQICEDYIQHKRWNGRPTCAHCNSRRVYRFSDGKRFKCSHCKKQFTVRVGTIFQDSNVPLRKWIIAMYLNTAHKKGISSYQLAKDIKVTQKTAWFMLQRIRFGLGHEEEIQQLEGTIQVDETFVGGKNKNRHADKKVKNSQGRSFKDKTPVFGAVVPNQYTLCKGKDGKPKRLLTMPSQVKCYVVPDTKAESIQPIIRQIIKKGSIIVSDEWMAYNGLNDSYDHRVVDHRAKEYVNANGDTSNAIENVWSHLKRSIIGIYHFVTRKHLHLYVNETVFRFNTRCMNEQTRLNFALSRFNCTIKYKQLIAKAA